MRRVSLENRNAIDIASLLLMAQCCTHQDATRDKTRELELASSFFHLKKHHLIWSEKNLIKD